MESNTYQYLLSLYIHIHIFFQSAVAPEIPLGNQSDWIFNPENCTATKPAEFSFFSNTSIESMMITLQNNNLQIMKVIFHCYYCSQYFNAYLDYIRVSYKYNRFSMLLFQCNIVSDTNKILLLKLNFGFLFLPFFFFPSFGQNQKHFFFQKVLFTYSK